MGHRDGEQKLKREKWMGKERARSNKKRRREWRLKGRRKRPSVGSESELSWESRAGGLTQR